MKANELQDTITVSVSDPVVRENGKYIAYTISGTDKDGPFEVFRRYSDFDCFRAALVLRWPGCFIPPIPSKKAIGNKETKFLEERKNFLMYFMEKIAETPHLWYSNENKEFIRSNAQDFEKVMQNLQKHTTEDIINKYKTTFSYLAGKEINNELSLKIQAFKNFIEKAAKNLEKVKEFCRALSVTREKFDQQITSVSNNILPDYERGCVLEYTQGDEQKLVFQKDEKLKSDFKEIEQMNKTNEFDIIVNMIRMELKEVEAFQEALKQREMIDEKKSAAQTKLKTDQAEQTKLQAGKTTFKSLFTKGSKEDRAGKLEKQISESQKELENYTLLSDLITVIIGYIEVDKFKGEKQNRYYNLMQIVSNLQYNLNQKYSNFWNSAKIANKVLSEPEQPEQSQSEKQSSEAQN